MISWRSTWSIYTRELMRFLQSRKVIELAKSSARGDPEVTFPEKGEGEEKAFEMLRDVVDEAEEREGPPPLSGLMPRESWPRVRPDRSSTRTS